ETRGNPGTDGTFSSSFQSVGIERKRPRAGAPLRRVPRCALRNRKTFRLSPGFPGFPRFLPGFSPGASPPQSIHQVVGYAQAPERHVGLDGPMVIAAAGDMQAITPSQPEIEFRILGPVVAMISLDGVEPRCAEFRHQRRDV